MKVPELIENLNTYPTDSLVVTEGYEEGYDSIKPVSEINLIEAEKKEWYLGKYEKPFPEIENGIKAVFLYAGTKEENK
jgi:hypothetical protein